MSLSTHSKFYFGHTIDSDNHAIDFDEGAAELQATLETGEYTLTEFVDEIERAFNEAGALTYTVTVNRDTRIITISASGTFSLLVSSGTRAAVSAYSLAGFTGADRTGAATYAGDSVSGSAYTTQFVAQDHVASTEFKRKIDATVNKSANGDIEVVSFGEESFVEINFKYLTNRSQPSSSPIRNRASGVQEFETFADYLITKAPVEYMPNEDDEATFQKVILEKTPEDQKGVGYKLKELYSKGLPGYFDSGAFQFRVIDS